MATAALVVPHFIQQDFFTQNLVDDLHRLERQRAEAQDAYQRQASDDMAATLQYYHMELEELEFMIRDRLWALTLGRGDEVDDARVRHFFGALASQDKAQLGAVAEHIDELDEATIAALATSEYEYEQSILNNNPRRSDPRAEYIVLEEPHLIPSRVVAPPPATFRVTVPDFLLPGDEEVAYFPVIIEPPCPICMEGITEETSTFHDCGHQYHIECLRNWLLSTLPEKRLPNCTLCSESVPSLTQIRSLELAPDEMARVRTEYTELAMPLGRRLYCPRPSCGSFLGSIDAPARACEKCERQVCTKCREVIWGAVEEHVCGVTEEDAVMRLARDSRWQRCNGCRSLVERTSGCHRMACRCGSQFCYLCGAAWKTCGC